MLDLEKVSFSPPGGSYVLKDVDLSLSEGSFILIKGASGAGKSTLLRLLVRLEEPSSGRILFQGQPVAKISPAKLRRQVAFLPQIPAVLPGSLADNLLAAFAYKANQDLAKPSRQTLEDHLQRFFPESPDLDQPAGSLSVGQAQRLCLARAILTQPRVLVLDEPTASLDPDNRRRIEGLVRELNLLGGLTVIMSSHGEPELPGVAPVMVLIQDKTARLAA